MIEYKEFASESLEAVKALYCQHGWLAYLENNAKLIRAFDRSLYILGAYDGQQLVAFIRCVGDGEHIVVIQDLIVDVNYLRQGIGKTLMRSVYERFTDVRVMMLMTDALDERANAFYQSLSMTRLEQNGCVAYMR